MGDPDSIFHDLVNLTSSWVFASIVGSHAMIERFLNVRGLRRIPALRMIFEEGEAKGKVEGKVEGRAEALAGVLRARLARVGRVSPALRRKIQAVTDAAELERLVEIALDAETLAAFRERAFPRRTRSDVQLRVTEPDVVVKNRNDDVPTNGVRRVPPPQASSTARA